VYFMRFRRCVDARYEMLDLILDSGSIEDRVHSVSIQDSLRSRQIRAVKEFTCKLHRDSGIR